MTSSERSVQELKSLVLHTLETNGVLGQIRAQLRANVYKAIDCDEEAQVSRPPGSAKLNKSPVGRLMAEVVAEFFEFYEFRHSLFVFVPESNLGKERRGRTEVASDVGLVGVRSDVSILEQLVSLATGSDLRRGAEGWHSSASSTTASSPPPQQSVTTVCNRLPKSDCDTPPTGHRLGAVGDRLGDRSRVGSSPGDAAAIASAIRSVVGAGVEEASKKSDDSQDDEALRRDARRKPLGKLPAVGSTGKDLLPLRSSEEVSLTEPVDRTGSESLEEDLRADLARLQQMRQIDGQIRLSRASSNSSTVSAQGVAPGKDAAPEAEHEESSSPSASSKALASTARPVGIQDPVRSPMLGSPASESASASNAASAMEASESALSQPGPPMEVEEYSSDMSEGSGGSIELTGNRCSANQGSGSSAASGGSPVGPRRGQEEDNESIGESMGSIEGYNDSVEARDSSF